jgi:hypothetical protein
MTMTGATALKRTGGPMTMDIKIPASLKVEHDELHAELVSLTKAPGRVGDAARNVATLLHPHFVKEEEYALPPLGLLATVAQGTVMPAMRAVFAMTDRLKRELPEMLAEHRVVVAALEKLAEAGKAEKRTDAERFAEKLRLHAETEEQVLYPAAILVGEYVKAHLGPGHPWQSCWRASPASCSPDGCSASRLGGGDRHPRVGGRPPGADHTARPRRRRVTAERVGCRLRGHCRPDRRPALGRHLSRADRS